MDKYELDIDVVSKQYYELRSCRAVAEIYGCSDETIIRFLKKHGINRVGWKNPKKEPIYRFKVTEESKQQIVDVYSQANSVSECATIVHCSEQTVRRVLQENGISYAHKNAWVNSSQADGIAAYYAGGHSVRETAEKFGVTTWQVNNLAKKRRLTNGRQFHDTGRKPNSKAQIAAREKQKERARQRIIDRLESLGFEYIDGYTDQYGKVRFRCCECGSEYERSAEHVRDGNVVCKKCEHEKTLIRQSEEKKRQQAESEQRKAEKEAERIKNNPLGLSSYQLEREKKLDEVFVCKECGKEYTPRQYVASYGGKTFSNPGFCSFECKKKTLNRITHEARKRRIGADNHRHRAHKYGCDYDSSVTLPKLIKLKGLRCGICGGMCNPKDHAWTIYMGPTSPTIDHIVPMSKGGGHTWDNVQVAHAICNSYKCDHVEEVIA